MLMVRPRLRRSKWQGAANAPLQAWADKLTVENSAQLLDSLERSRIPAACPADALIRRFASTMPLNPGSQQRQIASGYNGGVPFVLRDFQPADFDTLWRIDQDCFPPGISYSRTELKAYMRRRGSFTLLAVNHTGQSDSGAGKSAKHSPPLAAAHGTTAGFIVAEADGRGRGHIITIDVIAAARRFGVGSLLLRGAEDRLRTVQCRSVELETAVDNVSALSFYKRHGYSVIRTYPRYYSNGVDALVLIKELDHSAGN
jgi:[ribosomal protein S18]-alanine N-acetyltransferase